MALILPTRDGNVEDIEGKISYIDALILPTRDGNFSFDAMLAKKEARFDPTYKGWKPF